MLNISEEVFKRYGRVYQPGEVIVREGDVGETMFIIQEGEIRIHKRIRDRETTLAVLKAGDFFGEMAIIDREPRSASASAVGTAKVLILSKDIFESQIKTNPKIIMSILRKMSERLRGADRQIKTLLMRDNHSRVTGTLLLLMSKRGSPSEQGVMMDRKETLEELVSMTGLPLEKTEEVLETLRRAGIVKFENNVMIVKSADSLERFMNYLEMKEEFGL
ncbi:MAG: Crp/Fnr family transcriptional regulator [Candidatus Coatesbacteria bacterium]|nr:MAG: Crp/Fnr family transcriptional regulator [Candidatus Coatesbacteria bacterium]